MAMAKKFSDLWKNQTELGKLFGLSSIAVGKILSEHGLKDGKQATKKALDEEYATFTPLKDGTPFYLWNTSKVSQIISRKHNPLTDIEIHVNNVKARLRETDRLYDSDSVTDQKLASLMMGTENDEVPSKIRDEVKRIVDGLSSLLD
jgi:hypothetical protein